MQDYRRLGDWLLENGHIKPEDLTHALSVRAVRHERFGRVLVDLGLVSEDLVAEGLAQQYGYPYVDPLGLPVSPQAAKALPSTLALEKLVLVTDIGVNGVLCVIADPLDIDLTDNLQRAFGNSLKLSVAAEGKLRQAIREAYGIPGAKAPVAEAAPAKPKRKRKVDPQTDRFALIETYLGRSA